MTLETVQARHTVVLHDEHPLEYPLQESTGAFSDDAALGLWVLVVDEVRRRTNRRSKALFVRRLDFGSEALFPTESKSVKLWCLQGDGIVKSLDARGLPNRQGTRQ